MHGVPNAENCTDPAQPPTSARRVTTRESEEPQKGAIFKTVFRRHMSPSEGTELCVAELNWRP